MAEEHSEFELNFTCAGLSDVRFVVARMDGREEISRPFEFRLRLLIHDEVPLLFEDFDAIVGDTATISFGPNEDHPIHGVVREIQMVPISHIDVPTYEVRFVPRLADYAHTRGSWIYQDKTPDQILTDAFALGGDNALAEGDDFELSLQGGYVPREYVVQYEESVLDFVSRQAEHWGIYYFFDHVGGTDRLVFSDVSSTFPVLEGFDVIPFEPRHGTTLTETVREIGVCQRVIESQVSLREHNYRIPSVELVTPLAPVDETGIGDVHSWGDHFSTPDEGNILAMVRGQEMFAKKRRMQARTTVRGLRAGHRFTLTGAEPEAHGLAREYLVVAVDHSFRQAGESEEGLPYWNRLELLPFEIPFRPARITPKPKINGVTIAVIDAEADDDEVNVPVDGFGRYKLKHMWDVAGESGGRSSCWIRQATSAGGSGYGFSQGLHVGTEVLVFHIDGDPDRPVIAGAVSNFEQPAEVRKENANQLTMASRQGIRITFNDAK